ncbi:HEXXH motif domain-containing protein [Paractinoplanes abujensis]|uniref:HEXXH motif-containing protein n=1 Tax=Paractinoplanes abujensis TaxID=882441 RepID=A0A7W7D2A4_9ACTN|nr:HEXXH motif domain-containing protein [Actinoplanes abujensis]MBB4697985.1 HEXXH motif-containing protein [Actinoplanes abujensis]GID19532.1 HEXXH motif domain-containing protein [Actinoplanes abujensis]
MIIESPHHRVPAVDFAQLTHGRGTAEAVRRLAVSERSARMIVLYGLLHTLAAGRHDVGPLAPPAEAWRLITEAESADRAAAEQTMMYPLTGIWAAHVFRRLRGVIADPAPLWLDLGHLHALAAASAVRAGLDFTIDIPVRDGLAVLPGLGYATFPAVDAGTAQVEARSGVVTMTNGDRRVPVASGASDWHPAVRCVAETDGAHLEVILDDFDPYRNLQGYSAAPQLDPGDVERWRTLLTGAWRILVEQDRTAAESVAATLTVLVPIPRGKPLRPLSASCDEAFAAVLASMPDDEEQLASTLVHETQHVRLGAVLHLFRFVADRPAARLYAPWRDDPRPLPGLLQGVYAFTGVTDFYRGRGHAVATFEVALWRHQLNRVLAGLREHPALTPAGRLLVGNLAETVQQWLSEPIDPRLRALGEAAAADHFGQWRCYHLPVPDDTVDALTTAWLTGRPCPAVPEAADPDPVVDIGVGRLDSRAVLTRIRLGDPEEFARLRAAPAEAGRVVAGTLEADFSYVAGDYHDARDRYDRHLAANPGDPHGWLGLGLTLAALGEAPKTLLARPELVRAVARRIADRGGTASARSLVDWFESC